MASLGFSQLMPKFFVLLFLHFAFSQTASGKFFSGYRLTSKSFDVLKEDGMSQDLHNELRLESDYMRHKKEKITSNHLNSAETCCEVQIVDGQGDVDGTYMLNTRFYFDL